MSKPENRTFIDLPVSYFAIVLGTIGMGFAWRFAATIWPVSHFFGDMLEILATTIWLILTITFVVRLVCHPYSVINEIRHPLSSSYVSLFPATTMLVAIAIVPIFRSLATGMFIFGAFVQLLYAAWQSGGFWRGSLPETATTPGLYLPTVANNFISAMASGALGYHDLGLLFLGAGLLSWLSLEPAILHRFRSGNEVPFAVRPSIGIQLAPALVACNAYLSVNGGQPDLFAKMLFGYGLLQLIFLLRLFSWYSSPSFNTSFWSFSFGISTLATTALRFSAGENDGLFSMIAIPLFIFTNLIIGLLLICTLVQLVQGKLIVRTPEPKKEKL